MWSFPRTPPWAPRRRAWRTLHRAKWNTLVTEFLSKREGNVATSICLDLIERIKDLGERAGRLERELEERVRIEAPQLLELPGCGPMSAARIVADW